MARFGYRSSASTFAALLLLALSHGVMAQELAKPAPDAYPEGVIEIRYTSSGDRSEQPALFWKPTLDDGEKRPLLVALHTWSSDYLQGGGETRYAEWCQKAGWVFLHPNFRGPN